jgi:hypothetical protein
MMTVPPAVLEVAVQAPQPEPPEWEAADEPAAPAKVSFWKIGPVPGVKTEPVRFAGAAAHVV